MQKTIENISWIKEKNEDLELTYHKTGSHIKTSSKNDTIDLKFFSEFLYKQNCINQVKNYFLRIVDYDIDRISTSDDEKNNITELLKSLNERCETFQKQDKTRAVYFSNIQDFLKENETLLKNMATPEALKKFIEDNLENGLTREKCHRLYETAIDMFLHKTISMQNIKEIYIQSQVYLPKGGEFKLSSKNNEKTDLTFQKKISIHFNPRLVFNIDVFSENAFSNGSEHFTEDKIYASLKRALDIFDQKFCLKNFIPVASDEHQVNFKLFVFQEDDNYAQFSIKNDVDPNQFYAFTDPSLKESYISNMYVNLDKCYSKKTNTLSLIKSAFVRALTFYATGKTDLGPIIMEGLSEYISRSEEGDISSDFAAFYMEKDKYLNLTEIIDAGFFDTKNFNEPLNEKKSFLYSVAPTIIAYLKDTNLNFINLLLKSVNNQRNLEDSGQFNELIKIVHHEELKKEKEGGGLKAWIKLKLEEDDYYNDSLFSDLTCQQRLEQQLASLMIDDVNQFSSSNFVNASHLADSKKKEADLTPAYVISSPI